MPFLRQCVSHWQDFPERTVTADETWRYQSTPESKHTTKEWKYPGCPRSAKLKAVLSAGKVMATVFSGQKGLFLSISWKVELKLLQHCRKKRGEEEGGLKRICTICCTQNDFHLFPGLQEHLDPKDFRVTRMSKQW